MGLLFLIIGLRVTLIMGLLVSSSVALVLLIEITLFIFLFIVYDYKILRLRVPCVKYFFTQTLGRVLLLLSILFANSLLWGMDRVVYLSLLFGVCLKLGAFPMHFWVVSVYRELPIILLGLVGVPIKVLPLSLIVSVVANNISNVLIYILLFLGIFSIIGGLVLGLRRTTIRGVLGASSITHAGWFFFALGRIEVFKYFLLYSFAFLVVILGLLMSWSLITSIGILGLGGLPPFTVFVGKIVVLSKCVYINIPLVFVVPALLVSAIRLFYYLKYSFWFFLKVIK